MCSDDKCLYHVLFTYSYPLTGYLHQGTRLKPLEVERFTIFNVVRSCLHILAVMSLKSFIVYPHKKLSVSTWGVTWRKPGGAFGKLNKYVKNGNCGLIRGGSQQLKDGSEDRGCEGPWEQRCEAYVCFLWERKESGSPSRWFLQNVGLSMASALAVKVCMKRVALWRYVHYTGKNCIVQT